MSDDDLISLFIPIIQAGLIAQSITDVTIAQAYQPTQIGVEIGPMISFFKVSDHRYGFRKSISTWDPDLLIETRTTTQAYETTFQIQALVTQPTTPANTMTASDLINIVSEIMQDDDTITTLEASGVGILRVMDIRNPYFLDDRDQNEACPSFDFTLTHKQIITKQIPVIQFIESGIYRI